MKSEVTNEDVATPDLEGPGKRLQTIREAQGLDLSRVASLLHLSDEKLIALEADDYSSLPGSVFVQGYLRNYARLLGVAVEPVLESYQSFKPESEQQADLRVAQVRREVRSSHAVVRFFTWLIVLGLVGLVLTWWRGYLQWPIQLEGETSSVQSPITDSAAVMQSVDEQVPLLPIPSGAPEELPSLDSGGESLLLPVPGPVVDPDANEQEMAFPEAAVTESDVKEPPSGEAVGNDVAGSVAETTQSEDTAQPSESPAVPIAAEESPPSPQVSTSEVALEFSGDCWADIQDSSGSFKLLGVIKAGARHVLEGKPPYKIVLGNAAAVSITVGGAAYDLSPHVQGNVARFSLNPERVQ
jgi:cytoskeleton protein RodZ